MDTRILVPIRYAAWLSGDLGDRIHRTLQAAVSPVGGAVKRLPRGLLVESDEAPGPFMEAVHKAAKELEAAIAQEYPVFHREMGPAWTGTLQVLFPEAAHGPL